MSTGETAAQVGEGDWVSWKSRLLRIWQVVVMLRREMYPEQCPLADIICPVCGYYCLGKGGAGCIDKRGMVEAEQQATARHQEIKRLNGGE